MKRQQKIFYINIFLMIIITIIISLLTANYLKNKNEKTYESSILVSINKNNEVLVKLREEKYDLLQKQFSKIKDKDQSSFEQELTSIYQNNELSKIYGTYQSHHFYIDQQGITWDYSNNYSIHQELTLDGLWTDAIDDFYVQFDLSSFSFLDNISGNNYILDKEGKINYSFQKDNIQTFEKNDFKLNVLSRNDSIYYYITTIPNTDYYLMTTFSNRDILNYNRCINIISIIINLYIIIIAIYLYYHNQKWFNYVYIDSITKGYSYERFKEEYNEINSPKALIVMDINNFELLDKYYNTDFCLDLLCRLYKIISENLKGKGFCARKLDNCFIICLSYKKSSDIIAFIEKINRVFKESIDIDFGISLDYGICECHDEQLKTIEPKAIIAWKNAKKLPNQCYAFYEEEKINTILENNILLNKLEKALKENKLDIYFQAKYDVKTKSIIGSEALLRWQDDDGQFIAPQRFIPTAEETGFITKIDSYVLDRVCHIMSDLKKEGLHPGTVSINVSRNKLSEANMVEEYNAIFKKYKLSKQEIELEITEGTVLSDDKTVHEVIQKLIERNFSILIDDFGTGYSSISMLKNLQMKGIKIDRAFVVDETKKGKEILKYVVTLAKGLNLETIAEGVEEESQYKYLKELGCDGIQGYYFSKPLPLEEYKSLLKENK